MAKGRRPLPWIKLWFDMIGDPKMSRLSIAERGCWTGILLLAGQSPIRGKLMLTETQPMSIQDIEMALKLNRREVVVLKSCISKMIDLNSLRWNDNNSLEVIHFKERQEVYPSDFDDYHKKAPEKLLKNSDKTPEKLQKEVEVEVEKDITPLLRKGARAKQIDPIVNEIFTEMRKFLGYPEECVAGSRYPTEKSTKEESLTPAKTKAIDPIPSYGKEGTAIKRMLTRGFTREEILACWKDKVSQRGGEFVNMTWVNEDIGKKGGEPIGKEPRTHRRGDKEYSAEELRQGLER